MDTSNTKPTKRADDGATVDDSIYVQGSVYFRRDVLEAVDALAKEEERSRSWLINRILRDAVEQRKIRAAA
jgi:hypothetical protein